MSKYLDFSTAEKALHSIEEAYRRRDIEGAVACKDFEAEAKLMLRRLGRSVDDRDTVGQTAEMLELSFRSHTLEKWPNFEGVSTSVAELTPVEEGIFIANEVGTYDGRSFQQAIYMAKTAKGWKVLNPVPSGWDRETKPWWKFR